MDFTVCLWYNFIFSLSDIVLSHLTTVIEMSRNLVKYMSDFLNLVVGDVWHLPFVVKAARCDCCKSQGTLRERVQWRGEMKHFCDQHCLLRFYCQQNEPNMTTQKGPENLHYGMWSFRLVTWKTCKAVFSFRDLDSR